MTLPQVERKYFVRKLGGTQAPSKPLNQLKREYFASVVGGTASTPFGELEDQWLRATLTAAGITTVSIYRGDLWRLMAVAAGQTPSATIQANQMLFYLNAA